MAPELFLDMPYKGKPVDVFFMFVLDNPFENVKDGDHYEHLRKGDGGELKFWA